VFVFFNWWLVLAFQTGGWCFVFFKLALGVVFLTALVLFFNWRWCYKLYWQYWFTYRYWCYLTLDFEELTEKLELSRSLCFFSYFCSILSVQLVATCFSWSSFYLLLLRILLLFVQKATWTAFSASAWGLLYNLLLLVLQLLFVTKKAFYLLCAVDISWASWNTTTFFF